ncbi:MAG: gamma-glutamyltransferase [Acidobacteria bacterium]|nr:gamma-glutamyltransferase [Acidobacteriota bacterium]
MTMQFSDFRFHSRRSVVMSRRGMAASSQPLAVEAAIDVLRRGGNAVDAAATATAVLSVIEPMSTGIGGDLFAIIWLARERRLIGVNASGRSSQLASPDALLAAGHQRVPMDGALSVTVPGALDGLDRCLATCGTIPLKEALAPAIEFAEHGFPVPEITAQMWARAARKLRQNDESARVWLPAQRAPLAGEIFRNPDLARTLRSIADLGCEYFYRGELAESIVKTVNELGGSMHINDLAAHSSDFVQPISTSYRDCEVVELPPNNQGLAALVALNIFESFNQSGIEHHSADHLHLMIEAMKLGLADSHAYVADPREPVALESLLSKQYAAERRKMISRDHALVAHPGHPDIAGDTVYVTVVDRERNVVSMISSVFKAFGSGVTVPGAGVVLQNRGACFTLEAGHPNRFGPGKRPFHTIIPALVMKHGVPWCSFGVVGGLMQAQAHLQVVNNLIDYGMNPQAALDAPRFRILESGAIALEDGISKNVCDALAARGHIIQADQTEEGYGGGQVILVADELLMGGSDPRKDGCAIGY